MKVSRFVSIIVLGALMVSFLMMPSAALENAYITKNCSCSASFSDNYYIGEGSVDRVSSIIQVDHACNGLTSYAGLTVWKYTTSIYNYRMESFHDDDNSSTGSTVAYIVKDYNGSGYSVLGVEATVRAITTCGSRSHEYRYFEDDGNVPMSVNPPVLVE